MTADHGDGHGHDDDHGTPATGRSTAPQSAYSSRDVGIGFVVLLLGLVLAFGVPILATL